MRDYLLLCHVTHNESRYATPPLQPIDLAGPVRSCLAVGSYPEELAQAVLAGSSGESLPEAGMACPEEASLPHLGSLKVDHAMAVLLVGSHLAEESQAADLAGVLGSLVEDLEACLRGH